MKDRSRWIWWMLAVVACFYLLRHLVTVVALEGPRSDLDIVIEASRRFMAHEPVYRLEEPFEHTKPPLLMGIAFVLGMLPHFWVRLVSDLLNLALPFLILGFCFASIRWRPWALTWALMYPFWYREAGYGQYNLLIFWFVLLGARGLQSERAWLRVGAGALAALTLVIKPTQLYLLPWLAISVVDLPKAGRRIAQGVAGGIGMAILLALSYCWLRSPGELITDHREWFQFIPLSTAKHILGTANYGLPTLLTRLGLGEWVSGHWFLPLTFATATFVAWVLRVRRVESLEAAVWLMLAFSPMCWKANFGLLLSVAYSLAVRVEANLRDWLGWGALGMILIVSKASEYWMGVELTRAFGLVAAPLWLMAGAIAIRMGLGVYSRR